jgi:Neurotransmitter-gated ion-channel ligand binding domain
MTFRNRFAARLSVAALIAILCAALSYGTAHAQSPTGQLQWPPVGVKEIPPAKSSPVGVSTAIFLINLTELDELAEQFTVNAYLFMSWKDPRLSYTPVPSETRREVALDSIWFPSVTLVNHHGARESISRLAFVDPDGTVRYQEEFVSHLSAELNLRKFPFDSEHLHIVLQPVLPDAETDRVRLIADPGLSGVATERWTGLAQWTIVGVSMVNSTLAYGGRMPTRPDLIFTLTVKRQYSYYLWKIFFPLILMVIVSYSAYFIDVTDHYTQITIALTTILTVIAFSFSVESSMPKVPYLTYIDCFFLATYVIVFLALLVLIVIHTMVKRNNHRRATYLRGISRWIYPIVFALVNAAILVNFFGW